MPMEDVKLNSLLAAEIASDIRADGRAHTRYLQVMDRVFLSDYLGQDLPQQVAGLNTASHAPTAQPFIATNFIQPNGKPVGT